MNKYKNLNVVTQPELPGYYALMHKNGKSISFSILGDLEDELKDNKWLRARVKYFNDNGTMEGY